MHQTTRPYTIDLFALHELNPARYPYCLESVAQGTTQARFDILFAFPQDSLTLTSDHKVHAQGEVPVDDRGFLASFDQWFENEQQQTDNTLPFNGGWFMFLGYEVVGEIEPGLSLPAADTTETVACAVRCPAAIIKDHQEQVCYLVSEDDNDDYLHSMQADIDTISRQPQQQLAARPTIRSWQEEPAQRYCQSVERIKHYITEGDVFQVNLSRLWQFELEQADANTLYRWLRRENPAPFAGFAQLQDMTILSSSPERLVEVRGRQIQTRPIAGTRPRSTNADSDRALSDELLAHPKEQAEHIMLIDLERNDLGRVCVPGTVQVSELMSLESYTHVHHIVSNVAGRLRTDVTPGDVIRACFPGGTITGCPKVRCMEIIAELEQAPRGAYTGSMGYINLDGSMDLNILIRTLVMQKQRVHLRAGAGIVYDSVAEHEVQETHAKARGMIRALQSEVGPAQ